MVFNKKIILLNKEVDSTANALSILADELLKAGAVKDNFYEGIMKRESIFPTGLLLGNGIGVAIPHTDIDRVNFPQIAFMSLVKPVKFIEMGTDDHEIEVKLIFMLALKEAHAQLETLKNITKIMMNTELVEQLVACDDVDKCLELITEGTCEEEK